MFSSLPETIKMYPNVVYYCCILKRFSKDLRKRSQELSTRRKIFIQFFSNSLMELIDLLKSSFKKGCDLSRLVQILP